MIWLASLVNPPKPSGPSSVIVLPIAWKIGSAASNTALSPPTMIESAPSIAPFSPPDTGASSIATPLASSALPIFCDTMGEIVDMSRKIRPGRAPSMMPSGPSATCSTSGELGSIVISTSDWAATSGRGAALAPALSDLVDGPAAPAVDDQRVAGLEEILGHGASHDPKTNESNDLRHGTPGDRCRKSVTTNNTPTWRRSSDRPHADRLRGTAVGKGSSAASRSYRKLYAFLPQSSFASQSSPSAFSVFGQRLAGLAVVADLGVPGVDHLLPLRADGLALGGAVLRRGAVALRRILEGPASTRSGARRRG